jgi:hypothetical protein
MDEIELACFVVLSQMLPMLTDIAEGSEATPLCGPPPPQRVSLRQRPTKKPKRLNIKPPKKATPAKKTIEKKVLTSSNYQQKKYVASIQGIRPEPIIDDFDVAP